MLNYKLAVLITTFLRDKLLCKTLQSIVDFYPTGTLVLIADQGYNDDEKNINIDYFKAQVPCEYHRLPFDCGLSYARNYLINRAHELNIPYILMSADSIQFTQKYDFSIMYRYLESAKENGLIGFELEGSKCPWEYNMRVDKLGIHLFKSTLYTSFEQTQFLHCEITRNIFLAKTESMLNLYDNELKLAEHELAFFDYKNRGYKVFWTNALKFKRVQNSNTKEYEEYRKRFNDYRKLLQEKLDISGWVILPKK
jgi:hypothetical protein